MWDKHHDHTLKDDLQVIDEKLRVTALAVMKSGEEWRRYATSMSTRGAFDYFEGSTRTELRGVLDSHGYVGRRVGERLRIEGGEEANRVELEVRDTVAEQVAATRELALIHLMSRERVDRTR